MKAHNGMRPLDIAVLLKIIAMGEKDWNHQSLAKSLFISQSEISESLNRSAFAGLVNQEKKKVFIQALQGFLFEGLKYVFPVHPGMLVRGMATSHAAPVLSKHFVYSEAYVWPDIQGKERGMAVRPLYPGAVDAAKEDPLLYDLLAIVDALRVGKVREVLKARELFTEIIKKHYHVKSH